MCALSPWRDLPSMRHGCRPRASIVPNPAETKAASYSSSMSGLMHSARIRKSAVM
jgi:hypothetical protein